MRHRLSVLGMPAPSPVQVLILRASYSWHSMRMCLIVCGLLPQWQSAESDTPMAARYAWTCPIMAHRFGVWIANREDMVGGGGKDLIAEGNAKLVEVIEEPAKSLVLLLC